MIECSAKIEGMDEVIKMLKGTPEAVDKAIVSSVNWLAARGLARSKTAITTAYNINRDDLSHSLLVVKAQRQGKQGVRMYAMVHSHGKGLALYDFKALPKNPPRQKGVPIAKRKKVSEMILKGGARVTLSHAFIAKMPNKGGGKQHIGVVYRTGSKMTLGDPKRDAFKEKFAFSAATMFEKKAVDAINRVVAEDGTSRFEHELNFYLGNLTKGVS